MEEHSVVTLCSYNAKAVVDVVSCQATNLQVAVASTGLFDLLSVGLNGVGADGFEAAGVHMQVSKNLEGFRVLALGSLDSLLVLLIHAVQPINAELQRPCQ